MTRSFRKLRAGGAKIALAISLAVLLILMTTRPTEDHRPPLRPGEVSLDAESPRREGADARRGERLAQIHCARCHGPDLRGVRKDSAGEEVSLGANITSENPASTYTAEDFCRAVREGLRRDGSCLNSVMPAIESRDLPDEDLTAIWTFSQHAPIE
jgi:mono/diheme cytochrome c family protein